MESGVLAALKALQMAIDLVSNTLEKPRCFNSWKYPLVSGSDLDSDSIVESLLVEAQDPGHVAAFNISSLELLVDRSALLAETTLRRVRSSGIITTEDPATKPIVLAGIVQPLITLSEVTIGLADKVSQLKAELEARQVQRTSNGSTVQDRTMQTETLSPSEDCSHCNSLCTVIARIARRTQALGLAGRVAETPGQSNDCQRRSLEYLRSHEARLGDVVQAQDRCEADRVAALAEKDAIQSRLNKLTSERKEVIASTRQVVRETASLIQCEWDRAVYARREAEAKHALVLDAQQRDHEAKLAELSLARKSQDALNDLAIRAAQSEHKRLAAHIEALEETHKGEMTAIQKENAALLEKLDNTRAELGRAEVQRHEQESQVSKLDCECQRLTKLVAAKTSELDLAKANVTSATEAAEQACKTVEIGDTALRAAECEVARWRAESLKASTALDEANTWLDRASAERTRLQVKINELEASQGHHTPTFAAISVESPKEVPELSPIMPMPAACKLPHPPRSPKIAAKTDRKERQAAIRSYLAARAK